MLIIIIVDSMSETPVEEPPKMMSLFIHEYRKKLSLLKTKSFYANHLCKKNCLEGKLASSPDNCFNDCDNWLKQFY